jgi:hypothetical protein
MMMMMMMIPTAGTAMAQPALVVSIRASADAPAVVLSDITWPLELCALVDGLMWDDETDCVPLR